MNIKFLTLLPRIGKVTEALFEVGDKEIKIGISDRFLGTCKTIKPGQTTESFLRKFGELVIRKMVAENNLSDYVFKTCNFIKPDEQFMNLQEIEEKLEKKMKKLKIENLQNFAKGYFKDKKCPIVILKKMEANGCSDINNKKIFLNQNISLENGFGADIGEGFYRPKDNINPKGAEQYFAVLLHEIGHFKAIENFQPPKDWITAKKRFKEDRYQKGVTNKQELKALFYDFADEKSYFGKKGTEEEIEHQERIEDLTSWVVDGYPLKHIKVVNWALEEFNRRKRDIMNIYY